MADRTELQKLQSAVLDMDCLANNSLQQISAVARLALAFMERPDAYRFPENIWNALENILAIATQTRDCIGSEAENVGFGYDDEGSDRRLKAWMEFRIQKEASHD